MTLTQTDSFVPLTSTSPRPTGERMAFQATVITQPGAAQKLSTTVASAAPSIASAPQPQKPACEPKVSVQRDGTRVTGIQVLCSCGEVIDLTCVYEAAAPTVVEVPQAAAAPTVPPQPATTPQPEAEDAAAMAKPGKICKDSGKDLPASAKKKPKKA